MLLVLLHSALSWIILQSTLQDTSSLNSLLQYGLAGAMVILLILMFRFYASHANKEGEKREKNIMDHNEKRENAYQETVSTLRTLIRDLDSNWKSTADRMDRNYQESISRFISVVDKVMDQNSYATQVLVELRDKVEHYNKRNDIDEMKREILAVLSKITLEYNLTPKNRS